MIWFHEPKLDVINHINSNCLVSTLGIKFTEVGDDYIVATMPVDDRTKQPAGLLHGGASAALSESLGSVASLLVVENPFETNVVGLEINANHLKSAKSGIVTGKTTPIRIGNNIHVWETQIRNEQEDLICVSRLTVMILHPKKK